MLPTLQEKGRTLRAFSNLAFTDWNGMKTLFRLEWDEAFSNLLSESLQDGSGSKSMRKRLPIPWVWLFRSTRQPGTLAEWGTMGLHSLELQQQLSSQLL